MQLLSVLTHAEHRYGRHFTQQGTCRLWSATGFLGRRDITDHFPQHCWTCCWLRAVIHAITILLVPIRFLSLTVTLSQTRTDNRRSCRDWSRAAGARPGALPQTQLAHARDLPRAAAALLAAAAPALHPDPVALTAQLQCCLSQIPDCRRLCGATSAAASALKTWYVYHSCCCRCCTTCAT
jgi:hypothetical protein